ncbi:MAG: hypothetical protein ACFFCZ_15740 [Promethearchaeota archaeon]
MGTEAPMDSLRRRILLDRTDIFYRRLLDTRLNEADNDVLWLPRTPGRVLS